MKKALPIITCLLLYTALYATRASAQNALRGQIFGPDGKALAAEVRFQIISSDGAFQQFFFSDSNGRIIVPALRPGKTYTLTIESDGSTYESTRETFNLETLHYLNVFLKPKKSAVKPRPSSETVTLETLGRDVPETAARLYLDAVAQVREGKLSESVRAFEQAIGKFSTFFEAHNDLGVVFLKLNRPKDAEKVLKRANELRPDDYRPLLNLGIALTRQERFPEAVEMLSRCMNLKPGFSDTQRYLGEALLEVGRLDEAEKELQAAMDARDANRPVAMIKLALVKVEKNDNRAAIQLLEKYLADYPRASNRPEIERVLKQLR